MPPEDAKSGESADKSASTSPQLSEADVKRIADEIVSGRIPGLMSTFQKQVNDAVKSSATSAANDPEKPVATMTPQERALKVREDAVATKEREVTQKALAVEYEVPPEHVTGATEVEMRLAATTYLLAHPKVVTTDSKPAPKPNPPSQGGNPPGGGSALTPLEKIQRGLVAKTKT